MREKGDLSIGEYAGNKTLAERCAFHLHGISTTLPESTRYLSDTSTVEHTWQRSIY
ncbi:hypothetical protein K439DRAFT_420710 [Ramaria rubella]|nr:hypothetical protein K439DRAFT_767522 [Ramaria rubella]KAF8579119.1 hypothetical protein K439DRAFT_420710 [Ramaria rubella]